ncbi:MAG: hypothetical protein H6744_14865 [Deltaproteobacteria bacterium]|nr:hypothetical protein [Deltaproteobacteria bacterium]
MTARARLCLLTACAVALHACAGGGAASDGEGADLWLDEGTGEASLSPLEPLLAGARRTDGLNMGVFDAEVERSGKRLLRYQLDAHAPLPDRRTLLLARGERGVELWRDDARGWLDEPYTLVPDAARVGLRWRVRSGGAPRLELEVTERRVEQTTLGERPVWTIRETGLEDGHVIERRYAEGLGLVEVTGDAPLTHSSFAVPESGLAPPRRPTLAPSTLEPLPVEARLVGNLRPTSLSLVRSAGASLARVILKGWRGCDDDANEDRCPVELCFRTDGASLTHEGNFSNRDTYLQGPLCVRQGIDGTSQLAVDGSGALVTGGDIYWVPRWRDGSAASGASAFPPAIFADPETLKPRLLAALSDGANRLASVAWSAYPTTQAPGWLEPLPPEGQWTMPETLPDALGPGPAALALSVAPPGDTPQFAWIGRGDLLMHSSLQGDRLTPLRPVATLSGERSVTSDERGQHLLLSSGDGGVDRVVVAGDTLVREAIAQVELPAGERLVGAVDLDGTGAGDGRLLVATWSAPPEDAAGELGTTRLYTIAARPAVRWDFAAGTGVVAAAQGADVRVCWPSTDEPLDPAGWSIGGVPAREVMETTEGCALVVRDLAADPVFSGRDLAALGDAEARALLAGVSFHARGPVPGVGIVSLGVGAGAANYADYVAPMAERPFAPLATGGYASATRLWSAGGVEEAVPRNAAPLDEFIAPVADRAGAGLWVPARSGGIRLSNLQGARFEKPPGASQGSAIALLAPPGGGLAAEYPTSTGPGWFHLSAGGEWAALPDPPEDAVGGYRAVLVGGELCGSTSEARLFCVDGDGVPVSGAALPEDRAARDWIDLADGTLLVGMAGAAPGEPGPLYRFDPQDGSLVPWEPALALVSGGINHALDGRAFGVVVDAQGARMGGELAPEGFHALDLSEWRTRYHAVHQSHGELAGLVPAPDRLWVLSRGCPEGHCARRASPIAWPE